MSKILFIDIPGVLNTSRSPYNFVNFDNEKVALLKDIVSMTNCKVVLSPTMPNDKTLLSHARREMDCVKNLMSALMPEWDVKWTSDVCIALAMFANKEEPITGFSVVRAHDTHELEWQLTFPTRTIHVVREFGITEENTKDIIRMLNTDVLTDEIPLKTVGVSEVKDFAKWMCPAVFENTSMSKLVADKIAEIERNFIYEKERA